jgi:hypothetical protein
MVLATAAIKTMDKKRKKVKSLFMFFDLTVRPVRLNSFKAYIAIMVKDHPDTEKCP